MRAARRTPRCRCAADLRSSHRRWRPCARCFCSFASPAWTAQRLQPCQSDAQIKLCAPGSPTSLPSPWALNTCGSQADGCTRVALSGANKAGGLLPLRMETDIRSVAAACAAWARLLEPRGRVLDLEQPLARAALQEAQQEPTAELHARFVTGFWGFADDVFVRVSCDAQGLALVESQSQLRLGSSDLGVNLARTQRLWSHLASTFPAGAAEAGKGAAVTGGARKPPTACVSATPTQSAQRSAAAAAEGESTAPRRGD